MVIVVAFDALCGAGLPFVHQIDADWHLWVSAEENLAVMPDFGGRRTVEVRRTWYADQNSFRVLNDDMNSHEVQPIDLDPHARVNKSRMLAFIEEDIIQSIPGST